MSRLNLKLCVNVGGQSSFHIQGKFEIMCGSEGRGSLIFPCPGQIWNCVWGVGSLSSFHVQAKSEILWEGGGSFMSALDFAHHPNFLLTLCLGLGITGLYTKDQQEVHRLWFDVKELIYLLNVKMFMNCSKTFMAVKTFMTAKWGMFKRS